LELCRAFHIWQVPLKILSIESGAPLREFNQQIVKGKKIDVIEQFNQKLLLKQEDNPLHIIDLLSEQVPQRIA